MPTLPFPPVAKAGPSPSRHVRGSQHVIDASRAPRPQRHLGHRRDRNGTSGDCYSASCTPTFELGQRLLDQERTLIIGQRGQSQWGMGNLMPIMLSYHTLCFVFRRKCIIRVCSTTRMLLPCAHSPLCSWPLLHMAAALRARRS